MTLTTILNFAVGKGCRADNPAATIDRPILDDRPVGILTVEQARGLLRVAKEFDPDMLPALAIGVREAARYAVLARRAGNVQEESASEPTLPV